MVQPHGPATTDRRLLLFKWLMILTPPVMLTVGHTVALVVGREIGQHEVGGFTETLLVTFPVALLALVLSYLFAETMFRVLRRLQAEASARERDIVTMNAVVQERERLSREFHDGVAQLVGHLLLRLDTIKDLVASGRPREADAELERLRGVADEIYDDIGESIAGLRTNIAERGLVRALQEYVEQFEERHEIAVTLRSDDLADHFRARGKRVVLGGTWVTLTAEESLRHADAVVAGEAEYVWEDVLGDLAGGRTRLIIAPGEGWSPSPLPTMRLASPRSSPVIAV